MRRKRALIVFDGERWHVRRVRLIEHNLRLDEKVYFCDLPVGNDFDTLDEAAAACRKYLGKKLTRPSAPPEAREHGDG